MKKILNTLSIVVCILGFALNAQTNKSAPQSTEQIQLNPTDIKSKFIKNGDYLNPSIQQDYTNYYGDSLKGFNEAAVRADLYAEYPMAKEFFAVLNFRKRDFIDQKYKLGRYAPKPSQSNPVHSNSKTIGSGSGVINYLPCVNEDFESSTPGSYNNVANPITGWTVESTSSISYSLACNIPTNPVWVSGSPEFSIVTTPILGHPYIGNIPNSPLGGTNVAQLNDVVPGFTVTRISTTFPVTSANTVFQFAFTGAWDGTGHTCCSQPFFVVNMYDCTGAALNCSSVSLTPPGPSCPGSAPGYSTTSGGISYTPWQIRYIDLTPYVGSCVTIRITNGDCNGGAHFGTLYFDARCGGSAVCGVCTPPGTATTVINGGVSYCAGSGVAQLSAPTGYATYSWVAPPSSPPISPASATLQSISVTSPVAGAVYTTYVTTPGGCPFMILNTINTSTVAIAAIGSAPSCAGGASGTSTVIGYGSGTGYNYTWLNSSGSTVGTASVATGLAPGVYSVIISGLGSAGCGSAAATTTVGTAPPGVINVYKPFCGAQAVIITSGGSGYQWYNMLAPIASSLGGNSPSITINAPYSGQIISVTYTSSSGCRDSVRYTLGSTPPGFLSATNISSVCTGGNNGTAVINMAPASGATPGSNYINVISTGTTPGFSASTGVGSSTMLSLSGLSSGSYSVTGFDGSCYYTSNFNVNTYTFTFNLSVSSATLCPGASTSALVSFPNFQSPNQFTYQWSPTTWLIGTTYSNSIVNPTLAAGTQSTITYSVLVTPTVINCPVTKTFTVLAVHPPTPTISAIPALCNTSPIYSITSNPAGGIFSTAFPPATSPIGPSSGLITPSNTNIAIGTNTFVYTIAVYNCSASTVGSYSVSQFQSSALTSSVPPLCVTSPAFNLMNIVQNTTGNWSGAGVVSNHFNPSGLAGGNYVLTYTTPSTPNPAACPSSTSISVSVTQTLVPYITPKPEFCSNALPFTMTATPSGGGWNSSAGVNAAGLVTPSGISSPNLPVIYTVNVGPCLNVATTTLHISQFVPATLTGLIPNLCYNSSGFNLMSIVQNSTGIWSTSANNATSIQSNTFFPAGLATGNYVLNYVTPSVPNPTLCADSRTIAVTVLNPPAPVITQVGPYCNNNAALVQLTVTPNSGHWVSNTYLSGTGVFNPGLSAIGNNAVQYIIGTSSCNRQQTKYISVEAFVPATIVNKIPDLCNNNPVVNLTPFTANSLGTWSGPGISGSNFNPALTGAGQFILTYNTSSSPSGLCPDVSTMAVNVFSLASPVVTQIGPFCNSSLPVQLQVTPVGGIFGASRPGLITYNGLFNPGAGTIGDNIINYTITSGPCVAYAHTTIKVEKFISADLSAAQIGPFCKTDQPVNLDAFAQNPGGSWYTLHNTSGITGTMFNPALASNGTDNIIVHLTNAETPGLCPDTAAVRIEVREAPVVNINIDSEKSGCAPFEVVFHTPSVNGGFGVWTINDGSDPINSLNGSHIFNTEGTYNIQFNYTDEVGCKAIAKTEMVTVFATPNANFSMPEEVYISDPEVQLINQSSGLSDNIYLWTSPGLLQSNELSPVVIFPKIGKYNVTLTATSLRGCKSEITKFIEVKNDFNVFIPNSFTPNFDGLNDVFIPVFTKDGVDMKSFEMEIFDRWGHSVYRTKDVTKGWDGSLQNKGEALQEGTYVYKIKFKDADGTLYEKTGDLLLLK